jgi:hypothetical protein
MSQTGHKVARVSSAAALLAGGKGSRNGVAGISVLFCRFLIGILLLSLSLSAVGAKDADSSCCFSFGDYILAPLRIHLLTARDDEALRTTLTDADIHRIVGKVNVIWAQAGLHFFVESILREEPAPLAAQPENAHATDGALLARIPAATHDPLVLNVYYIKQFSVNGICFPKAIFVKDTASLRPVEGGIDEPIPRVTSHELGHSLGLAHRQDLTNLMASGTTGTVLNDAEIQRAREGAARINGFIRAVELLSRADALAAAGKPEEARALYLHLSTVPVEEDMMKRVRERAAGPN